jgi:hypothetical protein
VRNFKVNANVWVYPGKAGWYFVSIPEDITEKIDFYFSHAKRGWGSLRVKVDLGESTWKTSIFPDRKTNTYLLPIKSEIRMKERVTEGGSLDINLEIED